MTKRTGYMCDVCEERIPKTGWWATFKRSTIRLTLRRWGIIDLAPVESGWQKPRFDVCDDCWTTLLEVVKTHVQAAGGETATDGGTPERQELTGHVPHDMRDDGDGDECPRCDRPSDAGLCGVCRDEAETNRRGRGGV